MLTRCYNSRIVVDLETNRGRTFPPYDREDITDSDAEGLEDDGFTHELSDVKIRDFNEHTGPTMLNLGFTELDLLKYSFRKPSI